VNTGEMLKYPKSKKGFFVAIKRSLRPFRLL